MKRTLRQKLDASRRRLMKRIDKANWNGQSPMIGTPPVKYELVRRTRAIAAGGIGVVQQLVRQLDIAGTTETVRRFALPSAGLRVTSAASLTTRYRRSRSPDASVPPRRPAPKKNNERTDNSLEQPATRCSHSPMRPAILPSAHSTYACLRTRGGSITPPLPCSVWTGHKGNSVRGHG